MTDDLIEQIREAGAVPPAPDPDAALARAMQAVRTVRVPSARLRRAVTALAAAALLALPAGVFQAVGQFSELPEPAVVPTQPAPHSDGTVSESGASGDVANPADRESVLDDPQPALGSDEQGHKGQGTPGGPSDEHAGDRGLQHRPF